jgi:hypothetical protein
MESVKRCLGGEESEGDQPLPVAEAPAAAGERERAEEEEKGRAQNSGSSRREWRGGIKEKAADQINQSKT